MKKPKFLQIDENLINGIEQDCYLLHEKFSQYVEKSVRLRHESLATTLAEKKRELLTTP